MNDPRVKAIKRLVKGFDWDDYGLDLVSQAGSDDWAAALAEKIVAKLGKPAKVTIARPDDERLIVRVNGREVASANHDEHGWSGMDAVELTAVSIARACGATLVGTTGAEL